MNDAEIVVLIALCAVALGCLVSDIGKHDWDDEDDDNCG